MLLGLPRAFSVHAFTVFIFGVLFGFFTFWSFGGSCHDRVRKQVSFAATSSRRVKFRSQRTEDSRHCVRHRCNVSGYRGDVVYRSFPPGRGCLRFVYGPPAEGGFLYLTHSRWEPLKEGRMKFLSPAFVFIHSEEVFMFAQSLHPVYTHSKQKNNWPTKSKTKHKCLSVEPDACGSRGSSTVPVSDPGKSCFHSSSVKSFYILKLINAVFCLSP